MARQTAFLIFLFFGTSFSLFGQIEDPVDWTFTKTHIEGDKWELVFTAHIESGWSVYSQFLEDGGPVPTSINFESIDGFEVMGNATETGDKEEGYDKIFEMEVVKYHDKLTLVQEVVLEPSTQLITGYVEYMTCDETRCLPPTPVEFEFRFEQSTNSAHSDGGPGSGQESKKKILKIASAK